MSKGFPPRLSRGLDEVEDTVQLPRPCVYRSLRTADGSRSVAEHRNFNHIFLVLGDLILKAGLTKIHVYTYLRTIQHAGVCYIRYVGAPILSGGSR